MLKGEAAQLKVQVDLVYFTFINIVLLQKAAKITDLTGITFL